jgi:pimeloyl-ACP methyl ester carboxylesterase
MFAADVASVLAKLALGPAHIVGISMGGMIAFQLAVDAPELVRSLVIVNSGPALVPRTLSEKLAVLTRRVALRVLGVRGLAKKVAAYNLPRPDQAALRDTLASRLAENDPAIYRASMEALFGWSVEDRIGSIQCQTLIVAADQDYTPVSAKRAYAAKLPHARVTVIANSRHVTPFDQPEALNRVLLDFLSEHTKEEGA